MSDGKGRRPLTSKERKSLEKQRKNAAKQAEKYHKEKAKQDKRAKKEHVKNEKSFFKCLFSFFLIPSLSCCAYQKLSTAFCCVVNVPVITASRFKCHICHKYSTVLRICQWIQIRITDKNTVQILYSPHPFQIRSVFQILLYL